MKRVLKKLRFFTARQGERMKVAGASWRPGRSWTRRHRRGDSASVQDGIGCRQLVCARRRGAGAYADCKSYPQSQGRACRTRACRNRYLVVRVKAGSGGGRRRQGGNWHFEPDRGLNYPTCAQASIPGLIIEAQRNADRGFPDTALFEVGQIFKGDQPDDQFSAASGLRRAPLASHPEVDGIGRIRRSPSTFSMPRPTPPPCWRRQAARCRLCKSD